MSDVAKATCWTAEPKYSARKRPATVRASACVQGEAERAVVTFDHLAADDARGIDDVDHRGLVGRKIDV